MLIPVNIHPLSISPRGDFFYEGAEVSQAVVNRMDRFVSMEHPFSKLSVAHNFA